MAQEILRERALKLSVVFRRLFFRQIIIKIPVPIHRRDLTLKSRRKVHTVFPLPSHKIVNRLHLPRLIDFFIQQGEMAESKSMLRPPAAVKGMTTLSKSLFIDTVQIKALLVSVKRLPDVLKILKTTRIKLKNIKPVVSLETTNPLTCSHKLILLDPNTVVSWDNLSIEVQEQLKEFDVTEESMKDYTLEVTYDNWNFQDIMAAVLPDDVEGLSGFSEIGHIAHFNLRDKTLPYKHLIGEVLMDKLPLIKTVVNKLNSIDNTYRTFEMELLAGEANYITQTKENGLTYELDFSKVYWNSRLGNEHHLLTKDLKPTDVVFDVFAGVGPFSVPACKQRATVFANDLNPHSYKSLVKNIKLNKCRGVSKCFNLDGREFIESCVKEQFSKLYSVTDVTEKFENVAIKDIMGVHIFMNLPAIATTFLDAFCGLLGHFEKISVTVPLPVVQCHCFTNFQEAEELYDGDNIVEVKNRVINTVGFGLTENEIDVRFVRNVAPQKDMMCVSFKLTKAILLGKPNQNKESQHSDSKATRAKGDNHEDEPPLKQAKTDCGEDGTTVTNNS